MNKGGTEARGAEIIVHSDASPEKVVKLALALQKAFGLPSTATGKPLKARATIHRGLGGKTYKRIFPGKKTS